MNKLFTGMRPVTNNRNGNNVFCLICGLTAEVEALFDVGEGITVVERYCEACSGEIK